MVQGQSWKCQLDIEQISTCRLTSDSQCRSFGDRIGAGASSKGGWSGADSDIGGDSSSGPNHSVVAG